MKHIHQIAIKYLTYLVLNLKLARQQPSLNQLAPLKLLFKGAHLLEGRKYAHPSTW